MRKYKIKTITQDFKAGPEIMGDLIQIEGYKFIISGNEQSIMATEVSTGTMAGCVRRADSKAPRQTLIADLTEKVQGGEMKAAIFRVHSKVDGYKMRLRQLIDETVKFPLNEL